jgi:predicted O-linked N-acetylglucosamine transferase (SPINDLY family)
MIAPSDLEPLAARFHRFGALAQAEALYREALGHQPDNAELWACLGRVYQALNRPDEAVDCWRRTLGLRPGQIEAHNDLGVALMEQGRLADAIASFRAAIRLGPEYAEAHNNLAIALMRQDDPQEAAEYFLQVLSLEPEHRTAHCNLGIALAAMSKHQDALASFRQAVELRPSFAQAWLELGKMQRVLSQTDEAIACFERAAALSPDHPDLLCELGLLLMQQGAMRDAVARFEQALFLQPDSVAAYNNRGLALLNQGQLEEARLSFVQALYLRQDLAGVHNNHGLALLNLGRPHEAQASFEQAIRLEPNLADAHNNLGLALEDIGEPDDALASFERAVLMDPDHPGALTNLGNAYKDQGFAAAAIAAHRKALSIRPNDAAVHSNLLLDMQYTSIADPEAILEEARRYARQHEEPLAVVAGPRPTRPLPGRRLRIGYVSTNLREHPLSFFLEPILDAHDHRHFEIYCYDALMKHDSVTERLKGYADMWRSLAELSDPQAVELIRRDEIDILVDLDGHTGGNRLPVFAQKPAPIQVSYLGFLGTTGLAAMDYYLTDAHADPPGQSDCHYQEKLVRLPDCAFCYSAGPSPEVNDEPPACQSGKVTFGCLNNPAKVTDEVLSLWCKVLAAVPGSRLLIATGGSRRVEERVRAAMLVHEIGPERLLVAGRSATRMDYLRRYHAVDIGLDPFPYNGVTTTCDALWMGVPVISLAGRMNVSRQGVRFLRSVGLGELLAESPEEHVRIAVDLANDLHRLAALRACLRERMTRSPLMDSQRLARNLEAAYHALCEENLDADPSPTGP